MAFQARQAAGTTTEAFPDFSGLWSDRQRKDGDDSATCQITIGCTTGRDRFHRRCVIRSHPAPPPSTCPPLQFHPHKDPSILGVPPTRTPPSSVFHPQGPLHPRCSTHKDPSILGVPPTRTPPSSVFRPHKDPSILGVPPSQGPHPRRSALTRTPRVPVSATSGKWFSAPQATGQPQQSGRAVQWK